MDRKDAPRALAGMLAAGFALAASTFGAFAQVPAGQPDLAFGAFQRGQYVTALDEALKRVKSNPDDAAAMTLLGELHREGFAVRRDPEAAARWYRLAALKGDRQAQFALGMAHMSGSGVEKSAALAREWLDKAAAAGHAGALYNLGVMALEAEVQDPKTAARFFEKAAAGGDADAAYGLAILLREGAGLPRDRARALVFLKQAADEKHLAAMVEYAIALFNGDGLERNEAEAARLFAAAAARHSPVAQNRLARLYAAGRGVKANMVEAMKWHILARAGGLSDPWLESRLPSLTTEERAAVELAVQRFIGK